MPRWITVLLGYLGAGLKLSESPVFLLAGLSHIVALLCLGYFEAGVVSFPIVFLILVLLLVFCVCSFLGQNNIFLLTRKIEEDNQNNLPRPSRPKVVFGPYVLWVCAVVLGAKFFHLILSGPNNIFWFAIYIAVMLFLWWAHIAFAVPQQQWRLSSKNSLLFVLDLWKKNYYWLILICLATFFFWLPFIALFLKFALVDTDYKIIFLATALLLSSRGLAMLLATSYFFIATVAKPRSFSVQLSGQASAASEETPTEG